LSFADNARDALLLHVPSSSERKERGNNRGLMKKTIKRATGNPKTSSCLLRFVFL
jgi:hypothetical protein